MLTDQHSTFLSQQSCSQSVVDDKERAVSALSYADDEQLWLTYKAIQPTRSLALRVDVDLD
jgi:hypothetical protein